MTSAAQERLGKVPCPACSEPTMVRRNGQGTLSLSCQDCGFSAFAKKGEKAHAELLKKLPASATPAPAPAPTPAPAPAPKPARPASAFNLGDLT